VASLLIAYPRSLPPLRRSAQVQNFLGPVCGKLAQMRPPPDHEGGG